MYIGKQIQYHFRRMSNIMDYNLINIQPRSRENNDIKKEVDKIMSKNGKYTQEEVNGILSRELVTPLEVRLIHQYYKDL